MNLTFIVNEKSGNGKGLKIWQEIKQHLTVNYDIYITTYKKQAIEFAKLIAKQSNELKQYTLIVGIGGDGTYHEILNGIQHAPYIVLGAVCAGSGNDFKRAYKQFKDAREIEQFLCDPMHSIQDAGIVKSEQQKLYFINNSGIGFDATVAITANESKVKKAFNRVGLGKLCYVYYLIKCLFTFKPFTMQLEQNGEKKTYQKVWFITASNQPFYGGGMKISPNSKMNDGQLELTIVHNLNKYKLLAVFITVFFGKHTIFKEVEQTSSSAFYIHMDENYLMHADGERLPILTKESKIAFYADSNNWQLAKMNND